MALVPVHDAGRGKADHANLDRQLHGLAIFVGGVQFALQQHIGRHQRRLGLGAQHVGQRHRETGTSALFAGVHALYLQAAAEYLVEIRQAVVELMVAQRARIELEHAHGLVHGQLLLAGDGRNLRLVIGQRRALDGVAVVHQQGVGEIAARLADERCRALKTVGGIVGQLEVVVAADVEVQIGRLQHGQSRRGRLAAVRATAATSAQQRSTGQRGQRPAQRSGLRIQRKSSHHGYRW